MSDLNAGGEQSIPEPAAGQREVPPTHARSGTEPQAQNGQRWPVQTLLDLIDQPAALVRAGRLLSMNQHLASALGHPRPDLLSGLPAHLFLEGEGVTVRVTSPEGPVTAERVVIHLLDRGECLEMWLLRSVSEVMTQQMRVQNAIRAMEAVVENLWADGDRLVAKEVVVKGLALAINQEDQPDATVLEQLVADAASRVAPGCLSIRVEGSPVVYTAAERVIDLLDDLFRAVTDAGARRGTMRLENDLVGYPTLYLRMDDAQRPCLPRSEEAVLRRRLTLVGGGLVVREPNVLLVRFGGPPKEGVCAQA